MKSVYHIRSFLVNIFAAKKAADQYHFTARIRKIYLEIDFIVIIPYKSGHNNSETRPQRAVRFCAAEISVALFGERTLCRNEGKKKIIAAEKSSWGRWRL